MIRSDRWDLDSIFTKLVVFTRIDIRCFVFTQKLDQFIAVDGRAFGCSGGDDVVGIVEQRAVCVSIFGIERKRHTNDTDDTAGVMTSCFKIEEGEKE